MDIEFLINGQDPSPSLGIFKGQIHEGVNQVSRMELLAVSDQELKEADLEDAVGQPATLKLSEPVDGALQVSRFDGAIYEFHQMNSFLVEKDLFAYRIVVRPWLWQLNIGANARAFPEMSRIEVIDEILTGHKDKYYDTNYFKESDYPKLWQILQCDISDWKFLCQLMREAGINYYFGAPKDGGTAEMMHLVDHRAFFPKAYTEEIPWNPSAGMAAGRRIASFETRARAVPESIASSASFGDGNTTAYSASETVQKGVAGLTFKTFGVEGQTESVAQHSAKVLSQGFSAERLTYSGKGDHFLIRAGEQITIGGPYLTSAKKVLVTAVHHRFRRAVPEAVSEGKDVIYENSFAGMKSDADIRPIDDLISVDLGMDSEAVLSFNAGTDREEIDRDAVERLQETVDHLTATVHALARSERVYGVMLGDVVEDTRVTDGKEMTCVIENERFPERLTAKVSVAWLVPGGGVTCLPREGMQVYFMLEQGPGGNNEAVVVGYRPSSAVPGRDPVETTKTHRLKKGSGSDSVAEKDSFSPKNRERVGIRGENTTCEVTLLDKEGAVSVNAEKDIYLIADESVSIRTTDHLHMADTVREQFGEVERYVKDHQNEWIDGDHDMTVSGNQTVSVEKDVTVQIDGSQSLAVEKARNVSVKKDNVRETQGDETVTVKKGRFLTVKKDHEETVDGKKVVKVAKDFKVSVDGGEARVIKKAAALKSDDKIIFDAAKKVIIKCGSAKVTIEKNGNVTIKGNKFTHKASSNVKMKGSKINLN